MQNLRWIGVVAVFGLVAAPAVRAQEPAKPGPEHEVLKKHEGTWDVTMKFGGAETKGTATYKMDLGGLWLASRFEGEVLGTKFTGHGMDTYDAARKKYVSVWFDSMSTAPMTMEGTYDAGKKTLTMVGEGPGPDGKPTKHTSTSEWKDDDTLVFNMYMGDGKEPMFTIIYKRRK